MHQTDDKGKGQCTYSLGCGPMVDVYRSMKIQLSYRFFKVQSLLNVNLSFFLENLKKYIDAIVIISA